MNTKYFIGAVIIGALQCTTLNAQVLGGGAVGGLGGSLGGGVSRGGIDVMGQGSGHGGFGAELERGSLRRAGGDVSGRLRDRTRNAVEGTHARAHSTTSAVRAKTRDTAAAAKTMTIETAQRATQTTRQVDAGMQSSLSAASNVATDRAALASAAYVAHDQEVAASSTQIPALPNASLDKSVAASADGRRESMPLSGSMNASAEGHATTSKDVTAGGAAAASIEK